jgi:predicted chitinase
MPNIIITPALIKAADSSNPPDFVNLLASAMSDLAEAYAIKTPLRVAHFLSQIGHESNFKMKAESGNYKAKRMREVFGCKGGMKNYDATKDDCKLGRLRDKLWTEETKYAGNAHNLLSYAYASRLGNGDEASGDGFKYRGRGMVQLTGKTNYSDFTKSHNLKLPGDRQDFVANPELLTTVLKYGVESAFFFWDVRNINEAADRDSIEEVTKLVNGGLNGLSDRKLRVARVRQVLGI